MAWYNTGTIALTNGSATVTGSGTNFLVGAQIGEALYAPDGKLYEIQTINSATVITLASNYLGSTASGQGYQIIPTQSLVADLASDVTDLISDFADVRDYAGNGKFNDGAVGTPGITFTQDQDNGLYRIGSNNWALAAGGIKQVDLSATDVEINYAGVKKLATTATGIDVTGTVTADGLVVDGASSGSTVATFTANANVDTPLLVFQRSGGAVAGKIAYDDTNTAITFGTTTNHEVRFLTNNTEKMQLTADGNLGIGTDSPTRRLSLVNLLADPIMTIRGAANNTGGIFFGDDGDDYIGQINYDHSTNAMEFATSAAEAMRIDASGNLLVGKTTTALATAGLTLGGAGFASLTRSGAEALNVNRLSSDGDLAVFYKDSVAVGSVGTNGGRLSIGSGDVNLNFNASANSIYPVSDTAGTLSDGIVDIGAATARFKDLYLSGNISTGIGAANANNYQIKVSAGTTGLSRFIAADTSDVGYIDYEHSSDSWIHRTGGVEHMRLDSSGNLLVGTTNSANLASATPNVVTDESFGINDGTNIAAIGVDRINFNAGQYYVLNETNDGVKLVNGATSWTSQSDENSKENIVELSSALTAVKAMRCVRYNLKSQNPDDVKIGFIAQDWQSSYPEVVATDTDGTLGMNYTETIPVLLKAIQEQQAIIEALTARIAALES
jgi:hypothetical protein